MLRTALAVIFLGYYWTGFRMVLFNTSLPAFERPAYASRSLIVKMFVGAFWPYVCLKNDELGWYFSSFVGVTIAVGLFLAVLTHWLSWFWAILVICIVQFLRVPFISPFFSLLTTIPAAIVLRLLAKFFDVSSPPSMARFER